MSITENYSQTLNKINDQDPSWRHFVKDFKSNIMASARVIELTPFQQRIYKYRLRDFLRENNYPMDLTWIIIWLNQLETELNFFKRSSLIIPDYQTITKIRNLFDASR